MSDERARTPREVLIAGLALTAIALNLLLRRVLLAPEQASLLPLYAALLAGGVPLLYGIVKRSLAGELGSDVLAGLSIAASAAMGEYLVGVILVLMLSGGGALEELARRRAASVLEALARRGPKTGHRKNGEVLEDVAIAEIAVGDVLVVFPHEVCPVDGVITEGRGRMDESYLTGEPFEISKAPGSTVLSGAVNGENALTLRAQKAAADSRYASIMKVMEDAEKNRPRLRRLGEQLAAWYAPGSILMAALAGAASHEAGRFLAVLVIATPCPLLIAIPVAVVGAISLSARRGIVVRNPAVLEQIARCRTVIFDKTGTLTFGKPALTEVLPAAGFERGTALRLAASLERYSRHPLSAAIVRAAAEERLALGEVEGLREIPGKGLSASVAGRRARITGRSDPDLAGSALPPAASGLECVLLLDGAFAAIFRFHDVSQPESKPFLSHLRPLHRVEKIMLVSGDRESEVRYFADTVGIKDVAAGKSPEEKLAIVREETKRAKTLFVGDGVNDGPALMAATVGVAMGQGSDVASQAAGAVIMDSSIGRVDELIHIGERMRRVALQSALGGMAASLIGMILAARGLLPALDGAIAQELIDLAAIMNALRVALPQRKLRDF